MIYVATYLQETISRKREGCMFPWLVHLSSWGLRPEHFVIGAGVYSFLMTGDLNTPPSSLIDTNTQKTQKKKLWNFEGWRRFNCN